MTTYQLLVVAHVLLFAYWLGADWGVYVNSHYVADPKLSLDERRRFLVAAFRIDLLPRISFTLLLPVGLQLATAYGRVPWSPAFMAVVWIAAVTWLVINVTGYRRSGTPTGNRMSNADKWIRVALAPLLILVGLYSAVTGGPVAPLFIALKLAVFGIMIVVGLILRRMMKDWVVGFAKLARGGPDPEVDASFLRTLQRAKYVAYFMWSLSVVMAVLGVAAFI